MIEARGIVKDFGEIRVVDHVDLEIAEGELFVLIGAMCFAARSAPAHNRPVSFRT